MRKISMALAALALLLAATAQAESEPAARAAAVAPFVDEQTLAVGHVDLTRIDPGAVLPELQKVVALPAPVAAGLAAEIEGPLGQLRQAGLSRSETLLGLYEGVPLTHRSRSYGMVPPDKITIFQRPIEERCRGDSEIQREIQRVVKHEIAHHFGIGDARLDQIERIRKSR